MNRALYGLLLMAFPAAAQAEDLSCNNGIVAMALHLDSTRNTITLEGASYKANLAEAKIAFSTTDAAGDKIDYVLDRNAGRLTETDRDRMPDGTFKTIGLTFACTKAGE